MTQCATYEYAPIDGADGTLWLSRVLRVTAQERGAAWTISEFEIADVSFDVHPEAVRMTVPSDAVLFDFRAQRTRYLGSRNEGIWPDELTEWLETTRAIREKETEHSPDEGDEGRAWLAWILGIAGLVLIVGGIRRG